MKRIYKIPDGRGGLKEVSEAGFNKWRQRKQKQGYQVFVFTRFSEITAAKVVSERLRQQAADLMWDEMEAAEKAGNLPCVVVTYNPEAEAARDLLSNYPRYHC